MKSKTKSQTMNDRTDDHFRFRMTALDRLHIPLSLFGRKIISHSFSVELFLLGDHFGKILIMKGKDIVKFSNPSKEEEDALMIVLEVRGDRVLVSDLRFAKWAVPPTDVYAVSDLEVTHDSAEIAAV